MVGRGEVIVIVVGLFATVLFCIGGGVSCDGGGGLHAKKGKVS